MTSQTTTEQVHSVLKNVKRIVVKVGTRVIDDEKTRFNQVLMTSLVHEIAQIKQRGIEVILVSSGAVGMGLRRMGVAKRPASVHLRQAYAAIGQNQLMNMYSDLFRPYDIPVAQVLLTRADLDRRTSYLNAKEALQHLLSMGIIPVINENDTVSINELKFGDNDNLASLVAGKMDAGLLILLTTVDGLFKSFNPKTKTGELIEVIDDKNDEVMSFINQEVDSMSMGGMLSKIESARAACAKNVLVAIANGLKPGILGELLSGQGRATWMIPSNKRLASWKYYLAFAKRPCGGVIVVDDGAVDALRKGGKSLLASGVRSTMGHFHAKDLVQIFNTGGQEVARGLVNFDSEDLQKIMGMSCKNIREMLNDRKHSEVVHRNNLVLT